MLGHSVIFYCISELLWIFSVGHTTRAQLLYSFKMWVFVHKPVVFHMGSQLILGIIASSCVCVASLKVITYMDTAKKDAISGASTEGKPSLVQVPCALRGVLDDVIRVLGKSLQG